MINEKKQLHGAIRAGERALFSLNAAKGHLDSAKNWGIVDLLGGGLLTNLVKHSKLENAEQELRAARRDLHAFRDELGDVADCADIHLNIGDFLTFADFFFDGLIADYMVQSHIHQTREQVNHAITQVERMLSELRRAESGLPE